MILYKGKYNEATVYTDVIDNETASQITVEVDFVAKPVYNFKAN